MFVDFLKCATVNDTLCHTNTYFFNEQGSPALFISTCWNCASWAQDKFQNFIFSNSVFTRPLSHLSSIKGESFVKSLLVIKCRLGRNKSSIHLLSQQCVQYINKAYFLNKRCFRKLKSIQKNIYFMQIQVFYIKAYKVPLAITIVISSLYKCAMQI